MMLYNGCRIVLMLAVCLLISVSALAGVRLEAPAKAARGDAFLALAAGDQPTEYFTFHWRGTSYKAAARRAADAGGQWQAVILLPVPLDEKAQQIELAVTPGRGASDSPDGGAAKARMAIALYDKDRPVQKLTVDKKYVNPPASQQERIKKDREKVRRALSAYLPQRFWTVPFERPVQGGVSSLFGMKRVFNGQPRSVHRGLDLRGAQGTPILACADGVVALADNLYFSGNVVYINHGEGVFSAYLHMSETKVTVGERVGKGQVVGLVGATGRVTGPHLHLSLIVQGQPVDPQPFLAAPAARATPTAPNVPSGNAH